MITFGNKEVQLTDVLALDEIAGDVAPEGQAGDELLVSFNRSCYTPSQVMALLQIVHRMKPDECGEQGTRLRLWWD